jgi:hypothetical protein
MSLCRWAGLAMEQKTLLEVRHWVALWLVLAGRHPQRRPTCCSQNG